MISVLTITGTDAQVVVLPDVPGLQAGLNALRENMRECNGDANAESLVRSDVIFSRMSSAGSPTPDAALTRRLADAVAFICRRHGEVGISSHSL